MPNLQTFSQQENAKRLSGNGIHKPLPPENSAKLCKCLLFLQTFDAKSLHSLLARKTAKMRTGTNHPNRKKSIVFAKYLLPDYSINTADTDTCEKRRIPFLRNFSQKLRNLHICFKHVKINKKNQGLKIQNYISQNHDRTSFHCIASPNFKKQYTTQKTGSGLMLNEIGKVNTIPYLYQVV